MTDIESLEAQIKEIQEQQNLIVNFIDNIHGEFNYAIDQGTSISPGQPTTGGTRPQSSSRKNLANVVQALNNIESKLDDIENKL